MPRAAAARARRRERCPGERNIVQLIFAISASTQLLYLPSAPWRKRIRRSPPGGCCSSTRSPRSPRIFARRSADDCSGSARSPSRTPSTSCPLTRQTQEDFQWVAREIVDGRRRGDACARRSSSRGFATTRSRRSFTPRARRTTRRSRRRPASDRAGCRSQLARDDERRAELETRPSRGSASGWPRSPRSTSSARPGARRRSRRSLSLERRLASQREKVGRRTKPTRRPGELPGSHLGHAQERARRPHRVRLAHSPLHRPRGDLQVRPRAGLPSREGRGHVRHVRGRLHARRRPVLLRGPRRALRSSRSRASDRSREIVHDIDVKDGKFARTEAPGIAALIAGIALAEGDDEARIALGCAHVRRAARRFTDASDSGGSRDGGGWERSAMRRPGRATTASRSRARRGAVALLAATPASAEPAAHRTRVHARAGGRRGARDSTRGSPSAREPRRARGCAGR